MGYKISQLSKLSNVSTRTIRYYDEIGLLKPSIILDNGYRLYGQEEVDLLQQILFYKELGFKLSQIKEIISSKDFDKEKALKDHLTTLNKERERIIVLIDTLNKTIKSLKGEVSMSDKEKFIGFKENLIKENEEKYGKEIRENYGDDVINLSNEKFSNMSEEDYKRSKDLEDEIRETLIKGTKDYNSEIGKKLYNLHKEWLLLFWDKKMYSKKAHLGLAMMYENDDRFRKYYDDIVSGGCNTLVKAIKENSK